MAESIHEHFMREAIKQAMIALEKGEVPIGAVVVHKGQVIARGYNQTEMLKDPTAHAEMIAMTQASSVLSEGQKDHRGSLEGVTVYVTLEPCPMCAGAMVLNKVKSLVYGAKDSKAGACESLYRITQDDRLNHRLSVQSGVMESDARLLLQEFFRGLRKERR
jgi:tRNA(adenine34) deaminase